MWINLTLCFWVEGKCVLVVIKMTPCELDFVFSLFGILVAKSYLTLATPWTVACQAPLSMRFLRQEYWSGLPFPSPGDLPNPGIEPSSPALQADSLPTELQGKPTQDITPADICKSLLSHSTISFFQNQLYFLIYYVIY